MVALYYFVVWLPLSTTAIPIDIGPFDSFEQCQERRKTFEDEKVYKECFGMAWYPPQPLYESKPKKTNPAR